MDGAEPERLTRWRVSDPAKVNVGKSSFIRSVWFRFLRTKVFSILLNAVVDYLPREDVVDYMALSRAYRNE